MVKLVTDTNLTASVNAAVAALVAGAPGALDTLNELATALGDDANFAATVTAALGNRLTWRGAWAPATAYVTNDVVTFNGGLYRAPNNFTSGGAFVLANWVELHPQTGTYASSVDFAAAAAGMPAQRLITDSDVVVKTGTSTSAATLRRTERSRRLLVVVNLGAEAMNVAEGTLDSTTIPSSGYTSVAVGSEWVTTSALPVFAYFPTTQSTARVYCELEG